MNQHKIGRNVQHKGLVATILLAIVLDANNLCHQISQLTQLTSPELLDQIKYIGQLEESLQQIVLGIYYNHAILQNLSGQDMLLQ